MRSPSVVAAEQQGEHRLPPSLAVVAAIAIYALLPGPLVLGPRVVVPAIEVVLLITVLAAGPTRVGQLGRNWERPASIAVDVVVIVANLAALVLLLRAVASSTTQPSGLLVGGIQVWATNVIGFGLLFWEIDRGGPVARYGTDKQEPPPDWQFTQDAAGGGSRRWQPLFVDYLYLSLTNSSAFSPTDTLPLRRRAKALMALQGTVALFTSLIVIARAINSLGS